MICCIPPVRRSRPFLSICIPTWNRSAFLKAQLLGLTPYLTDDIEVVVVDNGSEDDTLDVVRHVAAAHPLARIGLWSNEANLGADVNYLRALEQGSGTWLWLIGDDENIDPTHLSALVGALADKADGQALAMIRLPRWDLAHAPQTLDVVSFLAPTHDRIGDSIHKLGVFLIRREAALPFLKRAHARGIGDLHAYSHVTFGILAGGGILRILDVPGLLVEDAPGAPSAPRWNELDGTLGAWRTSLDALGTPHRTAAAAREVRLRMRGVFAILVYQLAVGDVDRRHLRWLLRAVPLHHAWFVVTVRVMAALPPPIVRPIARRILKARGNQIAYTIDRPDY